VLGHVYLPYSTRLVDLVSGCSRRVCPPCNVTVYRATRIRDELRSGKNARIGGHQPEGDSIHRAPIVSSSRHCSGEHVSRRPRRKSRGALSIPRPCCRQARRCNPSRNPTPMMASILERGGPRVPPLPDAPESGFRPQRRDQRLRIPCRSVGGVVQDFRSRAVIGAARMTENKVGRQPIEGGI